MLDVGFGRGGGGGSVGIGLSWVLVHACVRVGGDRYACVRVCGWG